MTESTPASSAPKIEPPRSLWSIVGASSAGTLIEWYDFYIFGALATTIATVFFPGSSDATALLSTLATFAIGFVVRPFGALIFGALGDLIGRKHTFMVTLLLMGGATFAIGILPGFATIGWAAPVILVILRLLQGLALGGEYGGAATYVAEHCPDGKRGYWTSWIQTTATLGLFLSLAVIIACRTLLTPEQFAAWGWRIPFWVSMLLVLFSYYIRRRMNESPLFQRMKASGKGTKNPLKESFVNPANRKLVLLALFGATAGQGVVWYTGQFYAMNFMKVTLGIEAMQAEILVGIALVLATPFFIVFGALSDRIGRKWIILVGCVLAIVSYPSIYAAKVRIADVDDPARFSLKSTETLAPATTKAGPTALIRNTYADGTVDIVKTLTPTPTAADPNPEPVDTHQITFPSITSPPALKMIGLVFIQVIFVTLVYGPIAAFLVELFPTRIRYTSMSLPYHIGNGVFGGLVPFTAQYLVQATGNKFAGLWYPMSIAALTVIIGATMLKERRNVNMLDEH